MTATASQAIAWAKKQTEGYVGLCLVFRAQLLRR